MLKTKKFEELSDAEFLSVAKTLGFDEDSSWAKMLWDNFSARNRRAATSTMLMMGYKKADVTNPDWIMPVK